MGVDLNWVVHVHRSFNHGSIVLAPNFVMLTTMVFICVLSAALAAGLTMGMVAISITELNALAKSTSATEADRNRAERLLELKERRPRHQLMVTLLLYNAIANEMLPVLLNDFMSDHLTIIVSVVVVLVFGEILPSAIFTSKYKMRIADFFLPFMSFLILLFWPVSLPVGYLLDRLVPEDQGHSGVREQQVLVSKDLGATTKLPPGNEWLEDLGHRQTMSVPLELVVTLPSTPELELHQTDMQNLLNVGRLRVRSSRSEPLKEDQRSFALGTIPLHDILDHIRPLEEHSDPDVRTPSLGPHRSMGHKRRSIHGSPKNESEEALPTWA